ncbi:hypothetical protein IAT38_007541 [Cryptococcus sp. DSM 104549]
MASAATASAPAPSGSASASTGPGAASHPFLFQSALHDTGLIAEMLASPLKFGPPVVKQVYGFEEGMREVVAEPRSPKSPVKALPGVNGVKAGKKAQETEESEEEEEEEIVETETEDEKPKKPKADKTTKPSRPTSPTPAPASSPAKTASPKKALGLHPGTFDLSWPEPIAHAKRAAGLFNPSMACYANATLQVLLHTPPVLRIALEHDEGSCAQRKKKNFCMLCVLKGMAEGSHWGGRKSYAPTEAHRNLAQLKKGFSKNRQEDTHEFFRFVTDALQNTALSKLPKDISEKLKHTSWVYRLWGGRVRSRVVCSRCNSPSDTFDSVLDLSLDVNRQGKKSIRGMMVGFMKEDKLEGDNQYHCDKCKRKANATKSFKIDQAPPVLTLHLKRFSINYNAYSGRARADKFNQFIEFGEKLDIAPYMVDPSGGGTKYRLFGVTCHRGAELRFGHYTSYVRGPTGQWFHADDEDMSAVSLEQVLSDKTAYLLSYIRVPDDTPGFGAGPSVGGVGKEKVNGAVSVNGNGKKAAESSEEEEEEEEETRSTNTLVARKKRPSPPSSKRPRSSSPSPVASSSKPKFNGFIGPVIPTSTAPSILDRLDRAPPPRSPKSASPMTPSRSASPEMPPELPSRFGYQPKPKPIDAASFYGTGSAKGNGAGLSKKEKRKFKHKEKGKARHSGAPMPFAQGKMGRNRQPGVLNRMKGRA